MVPLCEASSKIRPCEEQKYFSCHYSFKCQDTIGHNIGTVACSDFLLILFCSSPNKDIFYSKTVHYLYLLCKNNSGKEDKVGSSIYVIILDESLFYELPFHGKQWLIFLGTQVGLDFILSIFKYRLTGQNFT